MCQRRRSIALCRHATVELSSHLCTRSLRRFVDSTRRAASLGRHEETAERQNLMRTEWRQVCADNCGVDANSEQCGGCAMIGPRRWWKRTEGRSWVRAEALRIAEGEAETSERGWNRSMRFGCGSGGEVRGWD